MTYTSVDAHTTSSRVADICGDEHACANPASAAPANSQQLAELLRFTNENRLPITVQGSGSKTGWLNPGAPALHLLTHRMDQVLEHVWEDMTCTVEAGCSWAALQQRLAQHGQFVALDPLWPGRATVGGVIAANDSGAFRFRYGGLRDLLIGMKVVLADGTVARSGGKVVKNVAGYDLPKLFCGSFGTLAVIVEATFRLHSIEKNTATLTAACADVSSAGKLLTSLTASPLNIQALQLRASQGGSFVDVQLAGEPGVLAKQTADLKALGNFSSWDTICHLDRSATEWRDPCISDQRECFTEEESPTAAQITEDQGTPPWLAREALFLQPESAIVFKLSTLPTQIARIAESIASIGGARRRRVSSPQESQCPPLRSLALFACRPKSLEAH